MAKSKQKAATKADDGKPQMYLIDPIFRADMAEVLAFGEKKYGEMNYAADSGLAWSRLQDAAQRHMDAFAMGESSDPDTGKSHLVHAACCMMMLAFAERNPHIMQNDDRRWADND